jgi:hypothetical protein
LWARGEVIFVPDLGDQLAALLSRRIPREELADGRDQIVGTEFVVARRHDYHHA